MKQFEIYLVYAGHAAIFASTVWVIISGRVMIGFLLLTGFILVGQYGYVAPNMPSDIGDCWATGHSYYECLPFWYKLSAHLSQLGMFVVAIGIFQISRSGAHNKKMHSDKRVI